MNYTTFIEIAFFLFSTVWWAAILLGIFDKKKKIVVAGNPAKKRGVKTIVFEYAFKTPRPFQS
jgi:hypothetical protein